MSGAGKGSARRITSDAAKYAAGWARIWRRNARRAEGGKMGGLCGERARRDPGGNVGHSENNVKKVRQSVDNANRFA